MIRPYRVSTQAANLTQQTRGLFRRGAQTKPKRARFSQENKVVQENPISRGVGRHVPMMGVRRALEGSGFSGHHSMRQAPVR